MGIISIIPAILAIVLSFATKKHHRGPGRGLHRRYHHVRHRHGRQSGGHPAAGLSHPAEGKPGHHQLLLGHAAEHPHRPFWWPYFQKTGAIQGFSQWVHDKHLSRRGAQLTAWVLGMFVYFSDSFTPPVRGCTMRSITDKARISREKLAYIADSTSAPVSVLVPITGWAAYLSGLAVGIGCIATRRGRFRPVPQGHPL